MADATKAQRLLAAKKKVKEYQKNKKKSDLNTDNKTSVENLTNSTHSSLNEVQNFDENETSNQSAHSISPLQQYFTGGNSTVFDDINSKNKNNEDFYTFDVINYNNMNDSSSNQNLEVYIKEDEEEKCYDKLDISSQNTNDSVAIEDPEIQSNEMYNRLNAITVNNEHVEKLSQYFSSEKEDDTVNNKINSNTSTYHTDDVSNVKKNMQSLKQLSTQIIQMIDDNSVSNITKTSSELERRNSEICYSFHTEQEKNQKLLEEMVTYKARITELENESRIIRENDEKRALQLKQLADQIQCHQQTVNILVAEKSELANTLSQNETSVKQKTIECEELSARLKTSRSRVADLEKELNNFRAERQDKRFLEQNGEHQKLLKECEILRNQREETLQDVSELREKFNTSTSENLKLKQEVQELTSQLSLLNIKLQQLSSGVDHQFNGHIEGLTQRINMLEKQIIDSNNIIKTLTIEKEQTGVQYQQYVQQLNGQLGAVVQKLEEKTEENEKLVSREQQLTNQMGELEKLLQKMQNDQQVIISNKNGNGLKKELEETLLSLKNIQEEKTLLEENYQLVISERDDIFKELELRKEEVSQLDEEINRLQSNQPDNAKLLAAIESDKVAASRAVAQNTELKKQLEEMQQAFIHMSNSKLELTELLNNQRHNNKELNEKLNQFESQVHTLSEAIEIKDKEMISLRESAQELNKYVVQQNQLEDRLRHYEAHDHSTHALQHELQESYKKIQNLRSENETLKFHLKNAENKSKELELAKTMQDSDTSEDKAVLLSRIEDLEKRNKEIETKLLQLQCVEPKNESKQLQPTIVEGPQNEVGVNVAEVNPESVGDKDLSREIAMKQLEAKFTKTMEDIANLEDEKQRLEHLVLQLQDETETIGEYVTLYQHQRGILKQRALERDEQMRQLTIDRGQMKMKINKLNELVKTLILEKGSVTPEIFDQHVIKKNQLCEEHAKTHQQEVFHPVNQNGVNNNNNKTAEKIIELLSDIKTSNLIQPSSETTETFHPCPWCSGQLLTV